MRCVPQWLRAVESDAEVAYISRTADCLVMSRDVIMCNVIWLRDTNTYTLAVRATHLAPPDFFVVQSSSSSMEPTCLGCST